METDTNHVLQMDVVFRIDRRQAMHKLSNHCKALLERQVEEEGEAEGLSETQQDTSGMK